MTKNEIKQKLIEKLTPKLYRHSIATGEMAENLARLYKADEEKAYLAGILHDVAKGMDKKELLVYAKSRNIKIDSIQAEQPGLLHGIVASYIVKNEFSIIDDDILHAIEIHSTGSKNMSILDKILYLSDSAEPNRDYDGVEMIRDLAFHGELDKALLIAMKIKLIFVLEKEIMLHLDSIEAWNETAIALKKIT
jgi:predicted HD superfamily hydrolase involved in NAD metabolism